MIAEIRRRLYSLIRSDLSILEIQAELDALAAELQQVLAEELVSAGPPDLSVEEVPAGADGVPTDPADEPDAGTASPDATPATEASPDETPTEEPSESPTPVESSPSPEVTPEESPTTSATP